MSVAIVTTVIDAEKVLDSFIHFHLKTGFDHLYIFFDDPLDPAIARLQDLKNVTLIPCNDTVRKKWTTTNAYQVYGHLSPFLDKEPMARQILNMEIACQLAREKGIEWILHIDIDELFYSPYQTVQDHFKELDCQGISFQQYLNYEAIPEKENINDYFKEVTLFKKNSNLYSMIEKENHAMYVKRELFNYYTIGKMAARIDTIYMPGIHAFIFSKDEIGKPLNIPKPSSTNPVILHYVCCGFQFFWKKYITLGNFNENIFGREHYEIYKLSKNIVKKNDQSLAKEFYCKNIMLSPEEIDKLLDLQIILRIDEPIQVLTS